MTEKLQIMSADEAKKLAGPTAQEHLSIIEKYIKAAAEKKERNVIIRDKPYCNWLYGVNKMTRDEELAVEALERGGYTVGLYYEELQFVDMGLEIGW